MNLFINDITKALYNTHKINLALQFGGKVSLPSGKIYIDTPIQLTHNGSWLQGEGASTQLISQQGGTDMIQITGDRCHVSDLMLIGNEQKTPDNPDNPDEKNGSGIVVKSCYRPLIENVYIHDVNKYGIYCFGTAEDKKSSVPTISKCVIERAGINSIMIDQNCQDPIIVNTFTQDAQSDGLVLNNVYGAVITNSHFYRNGDNNVKIMGGGRHRFENCTLDRAQNWGVYLYHTQDIIMAKSIMFDNNQSGQEAGGINLVENVSNCIISNNTIYGGSFHSQKYGIQIAPVSAKCVNNIISYNVVRDSQEKNYLVNPMNYVVLGKVPESEVEYQ